MSIASCSWRSTKGIELTVWISPKLVLRLGSVLSRLVLAGLFGIFRFWQARKCIKPYSLPSLAHSLHVSLCWHLFVILILFLITQVLRPLVMYLSCFCTRRKASPSETASTMPECASSWTALPGMISHKIHHRHEHVLS